MGLFLRTGDDLLPLSRQAYDAESVLQELLAGHPDLLGGDDIEPNDPLRFLLVRREAPVKGLEVDHLFVDQGAVPTLVEVKKAENPDVRRKVIGQMLDYAANAPAEWTAERLADWLEERCGTAGTTAATELTNLEHRFADAAEFWTQAFDNLKSGNIRLVFVSDNVPESLQIIVEYLNERMVPTSVLAVEVRQYVTEDGKQLLSSRVLGQTEQARAVKGKSKQPAAIRVLYEAGELREGDVLWLLPQTLPQSVRPAASDPRLSFTLVRVSGSQGVLGYDPGGEDPEEVTASKGRDRAYHELDPSYTTVRARAVNDAFSKEPGGKTLGELAQELGHWTTD